MVQQHSRAKSSDFDFGICLGKGSFGVVHKVVRKADNKTLVIKQIKLANLKKREQDEALNEVSILKSLDSPHIVKYYDSFIEDHTLHIVMEYASKGNMHAYLKSQKGNKLPERLVWKFFVRIVLGLQHLHSKNILHRDVKTMNIFLDHKLNPLLGDLGVSKVLSSSTNFANTLVGTPYYLSPELCEGSPYNHKSDVWALGVVLYECCTLRHPFDAANQGALFMKIVRGRLDYSQVKGYSPELVEQIRRCLTHNALRRPDTAAILSSPAVAEQARDQALVPQPKTPAQPPAQPPAQRQASTRAAGSSRAPPSAKAAPKAPEMPAHTKAAARRSKPARDDIPRPPPRSSAAPSGRNPPPSRPLVKKPGIPKQTHEPRGKPAAKTPSPQAAPTAAQVHRQNQLDVVNRMIYGRPDSEPAGADGARLGGARPPSARTRAMQAAAALHAAAGGTASGGQVFGNRVRRVQTGNRAGAPHIAPPTPQIRALPPQLLAPPRLPGPAIGPKPSSMDSLGARPPSSAGSRPTSAGDEERRAEAHRRALDQEKNDVANLPDFADSDAESPPSSPEQARVESERTELLAQRKVKAPVGPSREELLRQRAQVDDEHVQPTLQPQQQQHQQQQTQQASEDTEEDQLKFQPVLRSSSEIKTKGDAIEEAPSVIQKSFAAPQPSARQMQRFATVRAEGQLAFHFGAVSDDVAHNADTSASPRLDSEDNCPAYHIVYGGVADEAIDLEDDEGTDEEVPDPQPHVSWHVRGLGENSFVGHENADLLVTVDPRSSADHPFPFVLEEDVHEETFREDSETEEETGKNRRDQPDSHFDHHTDPIQQQPLAPIVEAEVTLTEVQEREDKLTDAVKRTEAECLTLVGKAQFSILREILWRRMQAEEEEGCNYEDMSREIFMVIPESKVEAITMIYRMFYLEDELSEVRKEKISLSLQRHL